ncbi:CoA transferase [Bradyrhizobium yuanmingense]|uniref:CaiB/BaiF CoA transferase family protein n=1 Tax=Bradyrhizobium yuanmingense TaxID=108015 RepID=UPI0021A7FE9C|nr:CoA transferase [Bradyrhizobium sp. CB1024]UWU83061.1 CoA transferase [Bradyrhizobium sp. CB1024]
MNRSREVLSQVRVVEIGSSAATSYCARLFADFGAEVWKVEPPSGDPLRSSAPLTPGGQSAWFAFLNFNKSSIVINPVDPEAVKRITLLIEDCDILVDGGDIDGASCPPIDIAAIRQRQPALIYLDVSWFGQEGPYAEFSASDLIVRALAGLIKLVGPAEGPPLHAPDFQVGILAGLWGFIAAASAVIARMQTGAGRSYTVSSFEACISLSEYQLFEAYQRGDVMRRIGVNRFWPNFPAGIYETKMGWLGVTTITPAQWRAFCDMLGLPQLRDDPALVLGADRLNHVEEIERLVIPRLRKWTAQQWFAEGLKRKIPIVPVPDISALLQDQEKIERGAIVPILVGQERALTAGSMQRLTLTPPRRGGKVPSPGERQSSSSTNTRPKLTNGASTFRGSGSPAEQPLFGTRVIDFSMGWAGPLCTRTLADLGADVIKIEAIQYPDWWRGVDRRPDYVNRQMHEKTLRFCMMNRNKRGITLDLTRPDGLALAERLIESADVVVDNYSVDVLPRLGLGYEVLRRLNPRLVVMSMSAFGKNSVFRDCRAYGSTLEQASGLPSVVGTAGGPPVMSHVAFGDAIGGLNGCAALLVALIHARETGEGQFVDLAQVECMMPLAAPWIIIQSLCGTSRRYGNRHPQFVPHGCFRCAGDDSWIAITATDAGMWQRLASVIGRPDWAADPSLKLADRRRAMEETIESAIEAWTCTLDADHAMFLLQAARIAAGVVRLPVDLLKDPQLRSRSFFQHVERAFIGGHPQPSIPIREGARPYSIRRAAPTLGEHNREIVAGLLGLCDAEISKLEGKGIIGTQMLSDVELRQRRRSEEAPTT